jgi:DNA-binding NarL/FixJ family response regulator
MTTVLVVDDQFLIRAGLAALLRAAPGIEVVGEASDGDEWAPQDSPESCTQQFEESKSLSVC